MEFNQIDDLFRKVFESRWQPDDVDDWEELRKKFAFHMADVYRNVMDLSKVYESEQVPSVDQVTDNVELFFNHAMPHLIAAAQIFGDIPQIFEEQNGVHDWDSFVDDGQDDEPEQPANTEPLATAK